MFFVASRGLPFLLELGLLVYCLIDAAQTPPRQCRNLGKPWWIVLIVVLPLAGGIAWLLAGRPSQRDLAPDDDAEFLEHLGRRRTKPQDGEGSGGGWVERGP